MLHRRLIDDSSMEQEWGLGAAVGVNAGAGAGAGLGAGKQCVELDNLQQSTKVKDTSQ